MSSCKKSESKGTTGQKAAQAGAKSTAETARNAVMLSKLTGLTPAGSGQVLQSDKKHMNELGTGVNAQTVTGTESERVSQRTQWFLAALCM